MPYIGRGPELGVRSRFIYTATANQTSFSGNDDAGITLAYTDTLYMDVYQNGVLLVPATDYAATTGTSVVLVQGASADDTVELLVFDIFSVADSVSAKDGGTFSGTIAAAGLSTSSLGTSNFRAGVNAGNSITAGGNFNVTVGDEAGTAITTGDDNTFIGYAAGDATTTSTDNVAVGHDALTTNTTGGDNVAVGANALMSATDADGNTACGYQALKTNSTGHSNIAVGKNSLKLNTTGLYNVAIGNDALSTNVDGDGLTAIGFEALKTFEPSDGLRYTVAVGYQAGKACTSGGENVFVGGLAATAVTDGNSNVAIGYKALTTNQRGDRNVAIGYEALKVANPSGDADTNNIAIGYQAGLSCTTGGDNVYIGSTTGDGSDDGSQNTAVGVAALGANCGSQNSCFGQSAGLAITGEHNTCIGYFTGGQLTSGSRNIIIGHEAGSGLFSNGLFTVGTHNDRIVLGTTEATNAYIQIDWTVVSDERDKTEIEDIDEGLSFVNQMRPISYKFKTSREDNTPKGRKKYGFSAQDVLALEGSDAVIVDDDEDEKLKITNAHITPVLVNAIKELSAKNDALEARLAALEAK